MRLILALTTCFAVMHTISGASVEDVVVPARAPAYIN